MHPVTRHAHDQLRTPSPPPTLISDLTPDPLLTILHPHPRPHSAPSAFRLHPLVCFCSFVSALRHYHFPSDLLYAVHQYISPHSSDLVLQFEYLVYPLVYFSFTSLYPLVYSAIHPSTPCSTRVRISDSNLRLRLSPIRLSLRQLRPQIEDTRRVSQGVTNSFAKVLISGALPSKSDLRLRQGTALTEVSY